MDCLNEFKARMASYFFSFNINETEILNFGPNNVNITPHIERSTRVEQKNRDVTIDSGFKLDEQRNSVVKSGQVLFIF